jgi:hypothetical protein
MRYFGSSVPPPTPGHWKAALRLPKGPNRHPLALNTEAILGKVLGGIDQVLADASTSLRCAPLTSNTAWTRLKNAWGSNHDLRAPRTTRWMRARR